MEWVPLPSWSLILSKACFVRPMPQLLFHTYPNQQPWKIGFLLVHPAQFLYVFLLWGEAICSTGSQWLGQLLKQARRQTALCCVILRQNTFYQGFREGLNGRASKTTKGGDLLHSLQCQLASNIMVTCSNKVPKHWLLSPSLEWLQHYQHCRTNL